MNKKELINQGILLLDQQKVKDSINIEAMIKVVENAYTDFFNKKVILPPVVNLDIKANHGEIDIKSGYIENENIAGVKVATGFYFNPEKYNIPTGSGTILLFDGETGFPLALLDGGYITVYRTGAAGAVAAKYLARKNSKKVFILGAGEQSKSQLLFLSNIIPELHNVFIYDLNKNKLKQYIQEMSKKTNLDIKEAFTIEEGVKEADIIITVTPSREAQIRLSWIKPGTHINAIGADGPGKQELEPEILKEGKVVVDSWSQVKNIGECQHAVKKHYLKEDGSSIWAEIGEITSGKKKGRLSNGEITIFDATGIAALDVAAAMLVYKESLKNTPLNYFKMTNL